MLPADLRRHIVDMRKQGKTLTEIAEATGKGKGTISYIVQNVELSTAAQVILQRKIEAAQSAKIKAISPEQRRVNGVKGGRACQRLHGARVVKNLLEGNGAQVSGLTYRKDELPYLAALNKKFNTTFTKQAAGSYFLDFADSATVIEVTSDNTQGIRDAISRFEHLQLTKDTRRRIIYLPFKRRETKRLRELEKLDVEVRHISQLLPS